MGLRFIIYAIILGAVYFGIRKIIADWRTRFKQDDESQRQRDLRERERSDVIDLSPDDDGVFRPGDKDDKKH